MGSANYAGTPNGISGSIATDKTNTRANGTSANLVQVGTTGASGTRIDQLQFSAQGTTTAACQVLLYKGATAAAAVYFDEVSIPAQTVTNSSPAASSPWFGPLVLAAGEKLFAALTVSPGVAINYVSRVAGDF